MNNAGWIKLHRSIKDSPKLIKATNLALWVYILLSVSHTEEKEFLCGKEIVLQPGQGVFSTPDLAKKLNVNITGIRRALDWLESEHQIEQQKTTKGTVITVVNWDRYQNIEQQNEQQMNNNRTTNEQQMNNLPIIKRNKELKNVRSNNNNTNVLFVTHECDEEEKNGKYQPIIDAWNELPITNIKSIRGTRLKMVQARLKEYTMDEFLSAISNIRSSPWLLGRNRQNWMITFDWFVKPNNFQKVYEGNYIGVESKQYDPFAKNDMMAGYNGAMEKLEGLIDE